METNRWTSDCLIPWNPERDGEDSERGEEVYDEAACPEGALTQEEIAERSARVWRCTKCQQDLKITDWRLPTACWNRGGNTFPLATDHPGPHSDRC